MIVAVVVAAVVTAGAALYAIMPLLGTAGMSFASVGAAIGAMTSGSLTLAGAIVAGAGAGFGSGFAGSLLNGGSIGDAFKAGLIGAAVGGITGGLTHGIGSAFEGARGFDAWAGRALAHGGIQGAAAEAQGGQFRHGFYSGFITAAASRPIGRLPEQLRFVGAAVVGGTASAIGGGKFANGAVSAAFQYLLNEAHHPGERKFRNWTAKGDKEESRRLMLALGQIRYGKNPYNSQLRLKSAEDLDLIEESNVPITIEFDKNLGFAGTTEYTNAPNEKTGKMDRVVGITIKIDPARDDTVVTLAHELWHARIAVQYNSTTAHGLSGRGSWTHLDAYAREVEVARAYGYHHSGMADGKNMPNEALTRYLIRDR